MNYIDIIKKKWPGLTVVQVNGPRYDDILWNQFDNQSKPTKKELDDAITAYEQETIITQSATGEFEFQDILPTPGTFTKVTVNKKGLITSTTDLSSDDISSAMVGTGVIIQTDFSIVPATSGTTTVSVNNNIPVITNGAQIWTKSFTPTFSTSKIKITGSFTYVSGSSARTLIAFIFRNSTCIGTVGSIVSSANQPTSIVINIVDEPETTSAITYSIRVGVTTSSTWYVNRYASSYFSGKLATSVISLYELA
jgi:hypothetical protein